MSQPTPPPDAVHEPGLRTVELLCERLGELGLPIGADTAREILRAVLAIEAPRMEAHVRDALQTSLDTIRVAAQAGLGALGQHDAGADPPRRRPRRSRCSTPRHAAPARRPARRPRRRAPRPPGGRWPSAIPRGLRRRSRGEKRPVIPPRRGGALELALLHFLEQAARLGIFLLLTLAERGIELHGAIGLGGTILAAFFLASAAMRWSSRLDMGPLSDGSSGVTPKASRGRRPDAAGDADGHRRVDGLRRRAGSATGRCFACGRWRVSGLQGRRGTRSAGDPACAGGCSTRARRGHAGPAARRPGGPAATRRGRCQDRDRRPGDEAVPHASPLGSLIGHRHA